MTAAPTTSDPSSFLYSGEYGGVPIDAELLAQVLAEPCIADGDLSDCPPSIVELVVGWVEDQ
jgi:hypothetical protein